MSKKNNKKDVNRVEFKLKDFFVEKLKLENGKLYFGSNTKVREIANLLKIDIKKVFRDSGIDPRQGEDHILDDEQTIELALKNNFDFEKVDDVSSVNVVEKILTIMEKQSWDDKVKIEEKPPVVTIMGHVDHGKTTLLDTIRKSNLTKKESGGITQKIGAYQIKHNDKKLTFIDTPGHEAFTKMRANGSKVTDIAVIVVAADDSVKPQTRESIDHANAANVPIIIAINKMDSPRKNLKKVTKDLMKLNVVSEEQGGEVPFVEISALNGEGIDNLLETIILMAELLELKSPTNILASGTVIESNIHKQRGNLITVIVQNGTLKIGDSIIVDDFVGRIKAMHNDLGVSLKEVTPGIPVEIFGVGSSPLVGSKFVGINDNESAKVADEIHSARLNTLRNVNGEKKNVRDLFTKLTDNKKIFNIILKTDSFGVMEAISSNLEKMSSDDIEIKIIRKDVGEVSTTDVTLAEASKALIYTFNLKTPNKILSLTKNKNIDILEFDIIYKIFEDVEKKLLGLHEDKFEEIEIGKVEIKKIFTSSKIGTILGAIVREGVIKNDSIIEVINNNKIILKTTVKSLQFEKTQLREVSKGRECGIVLKEQEIILKEGDILISKELVKIN